MLFVHWMHYIVISLFFHQMHRNQGSPVLTYIPNLTQSLQIQSGRNIRHSTCVINKTGAEGVCMFSIDCIKANGTHLGTCIDRFYIGSCCKLKESADVIGADILENNIDHNTLSSTTPDIPTHKTTPNMVFTTKNPIAQRTTTTQSISTKTPTELQTSESVQEQIAFVTSTKAPLTTENSTTSIELVTKENTTSKIQTTIATAIDTTTQNLPQWILISNVLSLSPKKTTKPPSISSTSTQSDIPWYTRFPTRKPSAKPTTTTTTIPSTTEDTSDFPTTESTAFDRFDETTIATDTTTRQSIDVSATEYQSETSYDFTTAPIEENNGTVTEETLHPIATTNDPLPSSTDEKEEEEQTTSIPTATTEPVYSTIAHSTINSTNWETYKMEGSSTTEISTSEFMEMSTTEEISSTTTIISNELETANYKEICGKRLYPQSRIVGGSKASFGRWPWQISLRQWHTSSFLHKCGATLLNKNWAITAAHCVEEVSPADLLLRLGEFDVAVEEEPYSYQDRRVQIVASHPKFDSLTFENDLALMRLHEPVEFQPNIIPVCLPETDDNFIGRKAFVTGWGRLYEDGPLPSILQEVPVPILNNTLCERMYHNAGYNEHIPLNSFICAGHKNGGRDSCGGDSGGPLVIQRDDKRFLLAGVISWGINCAEPNQPGIYTRISEFRDWINQIIQI